MKLKKVVIEDDNGKEQEIEIDLDQCTWVLEHGIHMHEELGKPNMQNLSENGQRRFMLKAWTGCIDYDTFQAKTRSMSGG